MNESTKKVVLNYLISKNIKFYGERIYSDNLKFIKEDIIKVLGYFPLHDLGFREIITKMEGRIFRQVFDSKGRVTKFISSTQLVWEKKYDDVGNVIYFKSGNTIEWKREYEGKNCITYKDLKVSWSRKYDDLDREIFYEDSNGVSYKIKWFKYGPKKTMLKNG